jgi:polyketide synthase PksN
MISYAQRRSRLGTDPEPLRVGPAGDLRRMLAESLEVPEPALDGAKAFAEHGLNSLLAVRFLDRVNRRFGLRLGVQTLFEHPSLDAFAAFLEPVARQGREIGEPRPALESRPNRDGPSARAPGGDAETEPNAGDIAIIGMAGRFPGADSPAALWSRLAAGELLVREVPPERWSTARFYDPDPAVPHRTVSKWAGLLDGIDRFDAGFFGISPREAAAMDPQQRLFLETAWHAFENAGYPAERLKGGAIGVYVGAAADGWERLLPSDSAATQSYGMTGNLVSLLAARISYFLDLQGPALVLDTACSASLVAVHLACRALLAGEVEMALAGGVRLFLDEQPFLMMSRLGMLSPDGRCRSFDAGANGIAIGEACAAIVLKPLARALRDGDRIDAVIKATGVNQDGRSNGITAPNPAAQARLLRRVLAEARVPADTIGYIEAHGTATPLGDPIEVAALGTVYAAREPGRPGCALGSIKSNLGHTSEAAGIAGLIKTALCLREQRLVPSLGFSALNPKIDLAGGPFRIATAFEPWPAAPGAPRRAGVSAFGLSGTNAHAILEEVLPAPTKPVAPPPYLIVLSARDEAALDRRRQALLQWLAGQATVGLDHLARTLLDGRTGFDHRLAILARDRTMLMERLESGISTARGVVRRDTLPPGAGEVAAAQAEAGDPVRRSAGLERLAALWVAGAAIDGAKLYPGAARALDLPGYPFAPEIHWAARRQRHPFLDPDAAPGETVKRFTPDDPVVRDHVIAGTPLLHAGVFVEMAALAAERDGAEAAGLTEIAWLRTLPVPAAGLGVRAVVAGGECRLLAEGNDRPAARCRFQPVGGSAPAPIDVAAWRGRAVRHIERAALDGSTAVRLGPSFPGFDELWLGPDAALARLSPASAATPMGLPPRLTDAAIQTAVALLAQHDRNGFRLRYPAGAAALSRHGTLPVGETWILARPGAGGVDVAVADASGRVALEWRGLVLRETGPSALAPPEVRRVVWRPIDQAPDRPVAPAAILAEPADLALARSLAGPATRIVAPDDAAEVDAVAAALAPDSRLYVIVPRRASPGDPAEVAGGQEAGVLALLGLVRSLGRHGSAERPLELRIVTRSALDVIGTEALDPLAATCHGLGKALSAEFPSWRIVLLDDDGAEPAAIGFLTGEIGAPTGEVVARRGGKRWEQRLEPLEPDEGAPTAIRPGGTYMVIGGMGRVGRAVCRYLAGARQARLVLVGRRALDDDRRAFLDELGRLGGRAIYGAADSGDPAALVGVFDLAAQTFGRVDGVIQAVVDPVFGRSDRVSVEEFRAALHPKVTGLVALQLATRGRDLDFLAVFSSIGAFARFPGAAGQSSYGAGCCFEAAYGAALSRSGERKIHVLHWGLWGHDALNPSMVARLAEQGTHVQDSAESAAAFVELLRAPAGKLVHARLSAALWAAMGDEDGFARAVAAAGPPAATAPDRDLDEAVDGYGRSLLAAALGRRFRVPQPGERVTSGQLRADWRIAPGRTGLFGAILEMLAREGLVRRDGDDLAWTAAPAPLDETRRSALLRRNADVAGPLALLERCVDGLPAVLTGEVAAVDLLFPDGSTDLVEAIYRDQPVLAACNALVAAAVAAYGGRARSTATIVEIGAGTGATARAVFAATTGSGRLDYHYTDLSAGLVHQARARLSGPGRHFTPLDIERDPRSQGFEPAMADIVIASDVLHATGEIATSLRHLALLLQPGGIAIVNETTRGQDYATLTFGLLDGWWLARDPGRRLPHGPLLDAAGWRRALTEAGFDAVTAIPAPGYQYLGDSPHTVFIARKGAENAAPAPVAAVSPRKPSASPLPGGSTVETAIRRRVAAALDLPVDRVAADAPFAEIGVDSIVAPEIAEGIADSLGITLRSTDLYNFATAEALARHIESRFPEAVSRLEPAPTPPAAGPASAASGSGDIAVIGMAGRFPGALDLEEFWRMIAQGRSAIREVDRFDPAPMFDPVRGTPGKSYAKWAGMLDEHDCFDPLFFSISPAEAEAMDPQQRLLLEEAWHALEDAGLPAKSLSGTRCGVFVGVSASNYMAPASAALQTMGASVAILSARLSYFLNLQGPTFPIDTGCSSSLVALHLACRSLRSGESAVALAAGVSCNIISPHLFIYLSDAGMASPTGRCQSFDDDADGFVPGEGVGVVVLKRLEAALADGDRIRAVIRGTAINQDGKTSGMTAPSATSQTQLEAGLYEECGVDPGTIGLIEAHGTGTKLGDPIEVAALTDAFAGFTARRQFCAIGSVKTNIGHAMAAAGMAGLIKAILALEHRTLPPTLNFRKANRHIDFATTAFFVNTEAVAWTGNGPRRAAVSSFGFSGTNAHVVLEEAPDPAPGEAPGTGARLFLFSAKDETALARLASRLAGFLRETPDVALDDLAYTLAAGRSHFRRRRAIVADSVAGLTAALEGNPPALLSSSALEAAARDWEAGGELDIPALYGARRRIISLPGYPFARERYWNLLLAGEPSAAHPLLERLAENRFRVRLTAATPILRDHRVQGRCLLPAAAFLELARAAAAPSVRLREALWLVPAVLDGDRLELDLDLAPTTRGSECMLRSGGLVHATVRLESPAPESTPAIDPAGWISEDAVRLDAGDIYRRFGALGFAYGATLRVIDHLLLRPGEAVARLIPAVPADPRFGLDPALLDGVLQTAAGIGLLAAASDSPTYVPMGLEALDCPRPLAGPCWVRARLTADGAVLKFDVEVRDDAGELLVRLDRLSARAIAPAAAASGVVAYCSAWSPEPSVPVEPGAGPILLLGEPGLASLLSGRRIIRVEAGAGFRRQGDDHYEIDPLCLADYRALFGAIGPAEDAMLVHAWNLAPTSSPPATLAGALDAAGLDLGLRALFLAARAAPGNLGIFYLEKLAADGEPRPSLAAASAFGRSLAAESSRLIFRSLGLDGACNPAVRLAEELGIAAPSGAAVEWSGGRRGSRRPAVLALPAEPPSPVRRGGTYLISGGAGGLGLLFAGHLVRAGAGKIALIGRHEPAGRAEALAALEAEGAEILFVAADVADPAALRPALARIRRRFGPLQGVIHAAGVLRDGFVRDQDLADLDRVLAPKAEGAVTLDWLTAEDPLDFFVLFGSTAAGLGVPGQAGYAAANGFLEGFAAERRHRRSGRSLAIAWPLWQDGGMQPPASVIEELGRRAGILPMPAAEGLRLFDAALALDATGLMPIHGRTRAIEAFMAAPSAAPRAGTAGLDLETFLREVLAEVTKLAPDRIDPTEPFEAYGIDSMMVMKLNARLEAALGELPKTLFFEYRTLADLASYLRRSQGGAVARLAERGNPAPESAAVAVAVPAADEIAIIGIAGLYPGAPDLDSFWTHLSEGRDLIGEIPPERWPLDGFYDPDRARVETSYSKWGGFIADVDTFDARFFNISPVEAEMLDPQARKFLEVSWALLENAGLTRESLFAGEPDPAARRGGVFVGVMSGDYQLFGPEEAMRGNLIGPNAAYWNIANRVSYFLDLHGPSVAVDTACSASLSAVHMACAALRAGDCTVALAGGVNLILHPSKYWILSKSGFASSDGRCRSFGAGGDGYVPGEGVGAVLLKPLSRARADGNRILAVIKGSAVNHGGRTSGYTVPNPIAQGALIADALARAGTPAETIGFVEAHGTGTALGDPIEIAGLGRALEGGQSVAIGSVKSNIGHLEAAAGIAALTKVVLQLQHGMLVPSLHAETLNPGLGLAGTPFTVQRERAPWRRLGDSPRRAGISSFGAGGANAHLVVEEAPAPPAAPPARGPFVVPLSAATPEALRRRGADLARWLRAAGAAAPAPADLARTLQTGREAMRWRAAAVVGSLDELLHFLDTLEPAESAATAARAPAETVALARHWAAGGTVDWDLAAPGRRTPVALPTYPFEKRRCWVTLSDRRATVGGDPRLLGAGTEKAPPAPEVSAPQPIQLDPTAPSIADHVVGGRAILPAAVVAGLVAGEGGQVLDLRLLRSAAAGELAQPLELAREGETVTLSLRGTVLATARQAAGPDRRPPPIDLAAAALRCPQRIAGSEIYRLLAAGGAEYGPYFQALAEVFRGRGEALATLDPAPAAIADLERFVLPPVLLDAALQLTFAVLPESAGRSGYLPVEIGRIAAFGPAGTATRVHARLRGEEPDLVRLDLALLDDRGSVVIAIDGLVARAVASAPALPKLRVLRPVWQPLSEFPAEQLPRPALILAPAEDRGMAAALSRALGGGTVRRFRNSSDVVAALAGEEERELWFLAAPAASIDAGSLAAAEAAGVIALFRLLQTKQEGVIHVVTDRAERVRPDERPNPHGAAVAGLAKAAGKERAALSVQVLDADWDDGEQAAALLVRLTGAGDHAIRGNRVYRKILEPIELPESRAMPWRREGVFVIAGGSGGIALALAEHLGRRARARIALIGRRPASAAVRAAIERIAEAGGRAVYCAADLTDGPALTRAIGEIEAQLGPIDLAIHAALVMQDGKIGEITEQAFRAVLAPKTAGLVNLAAALGERPKLLLFSSANAQTANPGQAAYAAASAFEDAFGLASGRARVIDWGFWGETGRVATDAHRRALARLGVYPISNAEGFELVERLLAAELDHIVPLRVDESVAAALGVPSGPESVILPDPAVGLFAAAAAATAAPAASAAPMVAAAARSFGAINRHGARRLLEALQRAGVLDCPETPEPVEALRARLGVIQPYHRLLDALLALLRRAGLVDADAVHFDDPGLAGAPDPAVAPYLALLDACTAGLVDVLSGRIDANALLFPGGSDALVAPIYAGNPVIDHFQELIAVAALAATRRRLEALPPGGKVRLIEIGAGTGGTTGFVLRALAPFEQRIEYVFTDLGRGFLDEARRRLAPLHPSLSTRLCDIEQPPERQGLVPGSFDIVIAANVLHATRRIGQSLDHVKSLLRPGGLALINEGCAVQDFNTLTFGLTRGWWLFEDPALRLPHGPLLDGEGWLASLATAGFRPAPAGPETRLQAVLLAESDGIVRPSAKPETKSGNPTTGRIEPRLREVVAEALRLAPEEVEAGISFAEYGADSIISVDLVRRINAAFGIELKTTALFNYSTVAELARYIELEHGGAAPAAGDAVAEKIDEARSRGDRLRRIIRQRLDRPPPSAEPPTEEDELLALFKRLEAGDISYDEAITSRVGHA